MDDKLFFKILAKKKISEEDIKRITKSSRWDQIKYLWDAGLVANLSENHKFIKKPFLEINAEEDLEKAKSLLDKKFVWIKLKKCIPLEKMVASGFVPFKLTSSLKFMVEDFLAGMTLDEIMYWSKTRPSFFKIFSKLVNGEKLRKWEDRFKYWIYPTQEFVRKKALKKADSFYLLMLFPDLVYKESKRPITTMENFKVPDYLKLDEQPSGDKISLEGKEYFVSPVTRYAKGMSRGLYYKTGNDNFCGTFYYFEPESTTYLLYENPLIGKTKSEVFLSLVGDDDRWPEEKILAQDYIDKPWYNEIFETGLIRTAEINGKVSKKYIGKELGYAKEDKLDQPICTLAKEKGFDVVIFKFMVGSHQIVTEVFDVRDRGTSFRHLAYLSPV